MKKSEFIEKTLTRLFETFMPPGMEQARSRILERQNVPVNKVNRAGWEMYDYTDEDRSELSHKLRAAAQEVITESMDGNQVEFGLLAPEAADYEIERVFRARDEEDVLDRVIAWAEGEGYTIEEPPEGSESIFDWRFDGRRLTKID